MMLGEQEASARAQVRALAGPVFDALERSGLALVATDPTLPDNPVIYVNAAFTRLTGYSLTDAVGQNCRFLQGPRSDSETVATIRVAVAAGEDIQADLLNQRKDGTLFWNRLAITPIRDANGATVLFLGTETDVTSEHGRAVLGGAAGVWEWDVAANRLYCDARFAELYGLDARTAFLGVPTATFFEPIDPADKMRVRIAVAGAMHGVETFSRDYRLVRPDGGVRWVSARGRPHFNDAGETVRFTGVLTDVTDQKRIEEQLRIAQTAGGIGSFEYVCGFGTVSVSDQFCRLIGVNRTDALSVRTINAVVEAGEPPIIDSWDEVRAGPTAYAEICIRDASSLEQRWLARRGDLISEAAGKRFVGVIYDITASKAAQVKLLDLTHTLERRVAERTRERDLVWMRSADIFTVTGTDGLLRSVNPAITEVLGYPSDALIGRRLRDLMHGDDADSSLAAFENLLRGKPLADFDCRMRTFDGDYRWINWNAVARDGELLGVGRDVTQRKILEGQLRQSQKMEAVGQLTGGLAHDFNNMLTGIIGGLDIVSRRIAEDRLADVPRFLEGAQLSAQRAAGLVHRLLAFSRQQSLDFKAVDVNELVQSMAQLLERTLGEQVQIEVDLDPDVATAASDPHQLESAILNLAINARDAMPNGGHLVIRTNNAILAGDSQAGVAAGDYVEICVSDTGEGMKPDVLAKVFEPFFTTKPIGQGTGLGLSMIYGFVHQTGGHVTVDSTLGKGTTIHLYLPKQVGVVLEDAAKQTPILTPKGDGQSVLVVEDDPSVRMLVMEVLRDLGYTAVSAAEPDTALEILRSDLHLDLLVTDVGLPGINGRQLADLAVKARPDLPVLFMTGYAEKATIRSDFLAPGMRMITKPFALEDMAVEIQKALVRAI